jgi:hypothetical protein
MRICNLLSKGPYPCILSALFTMGIKFDCRAIPILGVVMLLRLLVLNIFQLVIHDFQDNNHACSVMTVCFYRLYLLNHSMGSFSFDIYHD